MAETAERWRCFAGLPLPEDWRAGLARVCGRLASRLASRIAWTQPDNWHLTLKFLGEVETARLPGIEAALAGIAFAPLDLALGAAGSFAAGRAPRTLWAGLAQGGADVSRLAEQVEAALEPCGFAPSGAGRDGLKFRPHVTLGRVKDAAAGEKWGLVDRELGAEAFAPARVGELVLWRSILGRGAPKYVALRVFPAVAQPAAVRGGPPRPSSPRG